MDINGERVFQGQRLVKEKVFNLIKMVGIELAPLYEKIKSNEMKYDFDYLVQKVFLRSGPFILL